MTLFLQVSQTYLNIIKIELVGEVDEEGRGGLGGRKRFKKINNIFSSGDRDRPLGKERQFRAKGLII